jgi:hypothetical protein
VEEHLAFVAAGFAAAVNRAALSSLAPGLAHGVTSDPLEVRFVTGVVFFAVLIMLGRRAFRNDVTEDVSRRRAILEWLGATPKITALIPMVFYLRFGAIGPLGWGSGQSPYKGLPVKTLQPVD